MTGVAVPVQRDITRAAIRDGDPGALAALCGRRGPAVFAYCVRIACSGHATIASAEAFAAFRRAIIAPVGLSGAEADGLLRRVTRRAALEHAAETVAVDGDGAEALQRCIGSKVDFDGYFEGLLSPAEHEIADEHLAECAFCAATQQRLEAAERAFDESAGFSVSLRVAETLLRAMVAVAPVQALDGDGDAVAEEALRLLTGDRAVPDAAPPGAT